MAEYYTIAIIALLGAISPGPDFVVVSKNAIAHSRNAGVATSLGIGFGILFHSTYCILGLAVIISQSLLLFSCIKYVGAAYLIYLGMKSLMSSTKQQLDLHDDKPTLSNIAAFREGLLTNVLNPKCTLFMLSVFTMVVKPHTPYWVQVIYALELFFISNIWFIFISYALTHRSVKKRINKIQMIVSKIMGAFLVAFGIRIALFHQR